MIIIEIFTVDLSGIFIWYKCFVFKYERCGIGKKISINKRNMN